MLIEQSCYYVYLFSIKTSEELSETYENIFRVRRELFSLRPLEATLLDGTETQSEYETEYLQLCATLRSLCLFLVCVVSPATKEVSDGTATSVCLQTIYLYNI